MTEKQQLAYASSPRKRSAWWIVALAAVVVLLSDGILFLLMYADVITFQGDRTQSALAGIGCTSFVGAVVLLFSITGIVLDFMSSKH
jgi:hypothetical protein